VPSGDTTAVVSSDVLGDNHTVQVVVPNSEDVAA
jgi:hypothetical protein